MEKEKNMIKMEIYYMNVIKKKKKNGKGKEYNKFGEVIYEGEFLDDLKKNKENDERFKKCFLNEEIDGLWFEYYYDGSLKYRGGYFNSKRNGFGIEFICDNKIYEGEFLNGERNGKGKELYNGFIEFEGEYLNGERNGKGKEILEGRIIFEGEYLNGKRNGKGKKFNDDGKLIAINEYLNGKKIKKNKNQLKKI